MATHRFFLLLKLMLLMVGLLPLTTQGQSAPASSASVGRDNMTFQLGGTAQFRASFVHDDPTSANRVGFGIRRLRLRLHASLGARFGLFVQGEGANADFRILDLAAEYRLSPTLRLRAGRLISAQPTGGALTSHTKIDAIDRPVSAGAWARQTIGADGRDFGIEARLSLSRWHLQAFLHNGDGDWGRARGNFREDVGLGNATRGVHRTGLAATVAATYRPATLRNLEVGGFAGMNHSRNPNTAFQDIGRAYTTYGAHLYWGALPGSQPFRLKADMLRIRYETLSAARLDAATDYAQHVHGLSLFAAGRLFTAGEMFARYEHIDPHTLTPGTDYTFVTVGTSFSPSAMRGQPYHKERLTLAGTARFDQAIGSPVYGLVLQVQLVF